MNSDDVIDALEVTAKLLELHNENPFKIKAFTNAAYKLSKLRYDFDGKIIEEEGELPLLLQSKEKEKKRGKN